MAIEPNYGPVMFERPPIKVPMGVRRPPTITTLRLPEELKSLFEWLNSELIDTNKIYLRFSD